MALSATKQRQATMRLSALHPGKAVVVRNVRGRDEFEITDHVDAAPTPNSALYDAAHPEFEVLEWLAGDSAVGALSTFRLGFQMGCGVPPQIITRETTERIRLMLLARYPKLRRSALRKFIESGAITGLQPSFKTKLDKVLLMLDVVETLAFEEACKALPSEPVEPEAVVEPEEALSV